MSEPRRIQRKRTPGSRMPEGAVYVGRPSRWGNPFRIGSNQPNVFVHDGRRVWWEIPRSATALAEARTVAADLFALHVGPMGNYEYGVDDLADLRRALAGRDLACWCPEGAPCHADTLLILANGDPA